MFYASKIIKNIDTVLINLCILFIMIDSCSLKQLLHKIHFLKPRLIILFISLFYSSKSNVAYNTYIPVTELLALLFDLNLASLSNLVGRYKVVLFRSP